MIARVREWAIRLALLIVSLVVVVVGIEVWLGTVDLPRDRGTLLVAHPASPRLVRLAPGATARFTGVPVRTNRFGYRGPEWSVAKRPGVFRIALLGDSQTFGYGVREEDSFPILLEEALRASRPDREWEVLNFGLVGFNTGQEAEACSIDVRPFAPDLVLLGFFMNDVDNPVRPLDVTRSPRAARARPASTLSFDALQGLRSVQFLKTRGAALARRFGVARGTTTARYLDLFLSRSAAWRACEEGLRAIREETASHGASFAVLVLPFIVSLDASYPMTEAHRQVSTFCAAEGIACFDLLPAFLGKRAERLCVTPINNHMNAEGNRIAAEAILEWLRASGMLDSLDARPEAPADAPPSAGRPAAP